MNTDFYYKEELVKTKKELSKSSINLDQLLKNNLTPAEDKLFNYFRNLS